MTFDHFGSTAQMGFHLQIEVEKQLIEDLKNYGIKEEGVKIDWSNACPEGHCTSFLDGDLEGLSGIYVFNKNNKVIAEGWFDFIHGAKDNPLFVFCLFLSIQKDGQWVGIKKQPVIPLHIWNTLPEMTKQLCSIEGEYDSRWSKDPLVQQWKKAKF